MRDELAPLVPPAFSETPHTPPLTALTFAAGEAERLRKAKIKIHEVMIRHFPSCRRLRVLGDYPDDGAAAAPEDAVLEGLHGACGRVSTFKTLGGQIEEGPKSPDEKKKMEEMKAGSVRGTRRSDEAGSDPPCGGIFL